jgi:hypothetical protein
MSPANINITSSSSQSQFTKENIINALQSSGLKNPKKIAEAITKKLTQGTGTEEDIFQAASEVYDFKGGKNLALIAAIDNLNGTKNIRDKNNTNKATTATWENFVSSDGDSRNMVKSSIEEITKTNTEFTVDKIIQDLKDRNIILVDGQKKVTSNKHLHDNLVAMRDLGVTREDIIKATNSDAEWNKLLGTVKETEFQRQLIQHSIEKIKKRNPEFTVDDIIKDLKTEEVIVVDDQGEVTKNKSLYDTLVAIKNEDFDVKGATKDSETWNILISVLKTKLPPPIEE